MVFVVLCICAGILVCALTTPLIKRMMHGVEIDDGPRTTDHTLLKLETPIKKKN
jgi:hypothetical protein